MLKYRDWIDKFINELEWSPVHYDDRYLLQKANDEKHDKKLVSSPQMKYSLYKTEKERIAKASSNNTLLDLEPGDNSYKLWLPNKEKQLVKSVRYKPKGDMERLFDQLDRSAIPNENELTDPEFRGRMQAYKSNYKKYLSP